MENKLYEIEISFPDIYRKIVAPSKEEATKELTSWAMMNAINSIDEWVAGEAKDVSDKYEFADAKFGSYGESEFAKKKSVLNCYEVKVDVLPCYINVIARSEEDAKSVIWNATDLNDRIDTDNFEIDEVELCDSVKTDDYSESGFWRGY